MLYPMIMVLRNSNILCSLIQNTFCVVFLLSLNASIILIRISACPKVSSIFSFCRTKPSSLLTKLSISKAKNQFFLFEIAIDLSKTLVNAIENFSKCVIHLPLVRPRSVSVYSTIFFNSFSSLL